MVSTNLVNRSIVDGGMTDNSEVSGLPTNHTQIKNGRMNGSVQDTECEESVSLTSFTSGSRSLPL